MLKAGDKVRLPDGRTGELKRHLSEFTVEVLLDDGSIELVSLSQLTAAVDVKDQDR